MKRTRRTSFRGGQLLSKQRIVRSDEMQWTPPNWSVVSSSTQYSDPGFPTNYPLLEAMIDKESVITDETNHDRPGDLFFKDVDHAQSVTVTTGTDLLKPVLVSRLIPGYSPPRRLTTEVVQYPLQKTSRANAIEALDDWNPQLPDYVVLPAVNLAVKRMTPSISQLGSNLGYLVFLAELRDFKRLASAWGQSKPFRATLRLLSEEFKLHDGESVAKYLTRVSAEGRLMWSYAIKPFVSDCIKLTQALIRMSAYVDNWNSQANSGQIHTRHLSIRDHLAAQMPNDHIGRGSSVTAVLDNYTGQPIYLSTSWGCYREVHGYAHVGYRPLSIPTGKIHNLMRSYDVLGLGHAGSNIWNMLPFTFLIDYFADTDATLSKFDKNMTELPVKIDHVGYSVKNIAYVLSAAELDNSIARTTASRINYVRKQVDPGELARTPIARDSTTYRLPSVGAWTNMLALLRVLRR